MANILFPETGPEHDHRIIGGLIGALGFLGAAILGDTLVGRPDGGHDGWIGCTVQCSPVHDVVFIIAALLAAWSVTRPHKPDVQVTRNLVMALAIVAIVVGAVYFADATSRPVLSPGPGTWSLLVAGAALVYTGFRKDLWPQSRFLIELQEAQMKKVSRRKK